MTHDRVFSRKLATRVIDLDRGILTSWPGSFDSYVARKKAALESEVKQNKKFDRKLAEEEVWIRKGVRERRTRNEGRVRALMKMRAEARSRRKRIGSTKIELQNARRTAKKVIVTKDLSFSYKDGVPIVDGFTGTVFRGEKIGVLVETGWEKQLCWVSYLEN